MFDRLKILLLQARQTGDPMAAQEVRCFVTRCGVNPAQVTPLDLLQSIPTLQAVQQYDALMVGGSGDYYISRENLPGHQRLLDLFLEVVAKGLPTFASCFGYQGFVQALGGEIAPDAPNAEVGSYELTLTEAGKADPLLGKLPDRFWAQLGHQERAFSHPEGIHNLVSSSRSPFQAFRVPGKPIWGAQFHPELDRTANLERFRFYGDQYMEAFSEEERMASEGGFQESPETSELLRNFLELNFS